MRRKSRIRLDRRHMHEMLGIQSMSLVVSVNAFTQ